MIQSRPQTARRSVVVRASSSDVPANVASARAWIAAYNERTGKRVRRRRRRCWRCCRATDLARLRFRRRPGAGRHCLPLRLRLRQPPPTPLAPSALPWQIQKETAARAGVMADEVAKDAIARQLRKSAQSGSSEAPAAAAAAAPAPKAKKAAAAPAPKGAKFAPTQVLPDGTLLFSATDLKAAK
jgi:hypothetical protein